MPALVPGVFGRTLFVTLLKKPVLLIVALFSAELIDFSFIDSFRRDRPLVIKEKVIFWMTKID